MRTFLFFILSIASCLASTVNLSLKAEAQKVAPNEEFTVLASFEIPQGAYIYGKSSGETGLPTKLEWVLPQGFEKISEDWQKPEEKIEEGLKALIYKGNMQVLAKFKAGKDFSKPQEIALKASWLKCSSMCMPESKTAKILIEPDSSSSNALAFTMLGAFLGGIILNLMPCVFPVIGLKILSFAKDAQKTRKTALINAAFYSVGIIISFCALAGILTWLKSLGNSLGWGFQLQEPLFVVFLILLFFAMGLAFAGVFELGASLSSLGNLTSQKDGKGAAFFSGVLAVLVASPCTAPFMGSALGVALASNASMSATFSIFMSIGLGMAFPYVLLSAVPRLARRIPKPGAWMETFKQFLAFPLFATAIWLVWVFLKERNADALMQMLFSALILAFALWIFGKYSPPVNSRKKRMFAFASLAILGAVSVALAVKSATFKLPETLAAQNHSIESQIEELRKSGKIVYADFTASWCITCIANKKAVLHTKKIEDFFKENNVALLTFDWTNKNAQIGEFLKKFGRSGVPFNIVYPADLKKEPVILPEILTPNAVIDAIDKAKN
ncbi:protein-disulfide reductase DsbD family protein [Intestinicryptomonas porci]|uniref:Thioredoxin family protein n=1 Tax=Intestinicryptomonas porci TaxID=2926320 RepID=A0ABU4WHG0_9BACT|nr:thioredoxin family protein [Opitutales bacterium CLA-KB-P66]